MIDLANVALDADTDSRQPLPRGRLTLVEPLSDESNEKSAHPNWLVIIKILEAATEPPDWPRKQRPIARNPVV